MKTKLFKLPLYSPEMFVVVGNLKGDELYNLVLKRHKVSMPILKKEVDGCLGCCNMKGTLIVLWVRKLRGPESISILAHECLHATAYALKYSGVKFSASSEEAYTYLLDWMVENILKWSKR